MRLTHQIRGSGQIACPSCRVVNDPIDVRGQSRLWVLATYLCSSCANVHQYPWPRAERGLDAGQLEVLEHPEPQVSARPAEVGDLNATAKKLMAGAGALGLPATATFARGTSMDQYGHPGKVVESVVVLVGASLGGLLAIWQDGGFHRAWVWSCEEELSERGITDAMAWLLPRALIGPVAPPKSKMKRPAQAVAA